jgi:tetratricopeptide (TPR) repeat protein
MHRLFIAPLLVLISLQSGLRAELSNALGGPAPTPETISAYDLLYAGKIEDARKALRSAVDRNSQEAPALYGLACCAMGDCDSQNALELLCKACLAGRETPWAEFYLKCIASTLPNCSEPKPFAKLIRELVESKSAPAYLKSLAHQEYGKWLMSRGQFAEAAEEFKTLNYVTQWALLGPFDNRDNAGFAVAAEPETSIDFEKKVQGRNRPVSWFRPNAAVLDGQMMLSELFEPRIHVLAYAVTFVKADAAGWSVVRCGAAGALSIWINGEKIGSVEDHNDWGDEKLVAPVYLRQGWNEVLVKSAVVEDTGWGFALRFCDTHGAPYPGLKFDSSAEALTQYKNDPSAPPAAPESIELGLFQRLSSALKTAPDDISLLSAYAFMHDFNLLGKKEDRGVPKQLVHAVELAPNCPFLRLQVAEYSNDNNEAWQAAEAARASHPDMPLTLEVMASLAERAHLRVLAEDLARQHCSLMGEKHVSASALTLALTLAGNDAPITRRSRGHHVTQVSQPDSDNPSRRAEAYHYARLFVDHHPYSADGWKTLISLENSSTAKRALLSKALGFCGGDAHLRHEWSKDLSEIGKEKESAEFMLASAQVHPLHISGLISAAHQFRRAGDIQRAFKLLEEAREHSPECPELLSALALTQNYLGKTAEATTLYREVLRLKPNSPDVKDYLATLDAGKAVDRSFYAPYDIALKDLQIPNADTYPNDNIVTLLHQEVVRINSNYSTSRMVHIIAKCLRNAGKQQLEGEYIYYDPERQVVDVTHAAVITPDGRELSRASIHDESTSAVSGVQTLIYDQHHLKYVEFNSIEPGALIDLQYTIRDNGDNMYGDYFADTFYLSRGQPAVKSQYILDYPKTVSIQSRTFNTKIQAEHIQTADSNREVVKWETQNTPGITYEPRMPPAVDQYAELQVTTMKSWEEVGQWYWNLAKEQLTLSDEMKKLVADLTKDCKTQTEKVSAIHQWAVHKIRYLGIEFGRNGYKPHKASETFKALYGDCKDTATMITAMLRSLGIDSRLVLIRTVDAGAVPADSLPMPNLYNHCIACVRNVDGKDYWIDGTADYHRLGEVPAADQQAQVMVCDPKGGSFIKIPTRTPEENLAEQKFNVTVDKTGGGTMTLRDVRHGQDAPAFRRFIDTAGQYEKYLKDYAARRLNGAELTNWKTSKPEDQGPVWMETEFKIPVLAGQSGERRALPSTFEPLELSRNFANETKRNFDIELYYPRSRKIELNYELPDSFKVATVPEEAHIEEQFGKFSRKVKQNGKSVVIQDEFELSRPRITVAEYEAFKAFCNKVDTALDQKVLLDVK